MMPRATCAGRPRDELRPGRAPGGPEYLGGTGVRWHVGLPAGVGMRPALGRGGGIRRWEMLMHYEHVFRHAVDRIRGEGRYRVFCDLARQAGAFPHAKRYVDADAEPHPITVWCSNDYLGMGQHPVVLDAGVEAVRTMGAGAGGTRNISGTTHLHVLLERELAALHDKPAALLFTSGFVANEATLSTVCRLLPGCVIYSDEKNHASMIAGIRHSGCAKRIFRHNDVAHLEALLADSDPAAPKLIAFESVYSMDGDFAPIAEICDVGGAPQRDDLPGRGARRRAVRPDRRRRRRGARA